MIVSHRYRYVFVQVPRTASSSIGIELCQLYSGEPILHKHASYNEFLEHAGPEEKKYFVFAGTRNPLDCIVTEYFRRKAGERTRENRLHQEKHKFITDNKASFPEFVKKYHYHFHKPDRTFCGNADFVIRYEKLQFDFGKVLKQLGIDQKRPLPQSNRTAGKTDSYLSYYTPDIQPMIRVVLGKRMKMAGYEFPDEWIISRFKAPFLCFAAGVKTALFAMKISGTRLNQPVNPGDHDSYSSRLRRTFVEENHVPEESSPCKGNEDSTRKKTD